MKKILILHHGFGIGGAEKMRFALLRNVDRNKYDIKVCCIGEKGVLGRQLEVLGYKVDELRLNTESLSPSLTYRLFKYLRKEKPDILHTALFHSNFHGRIAGFFSGMPHMITEEHGEHRCYKGIKFFPYLLTDFLLSKITDFIVCCSERLKEEIIREERLVPAKVVHVENCLDANWYQVKTPRSEIRKKHNISDELVFIEPANLKDGKGHFGLIDVFKQIKDAGYGFKCFFAGKGPLEKMLREKCRRLDLSEEIIFLGVVENITDYLNASDVFVLPSSSEGLSIALMEAMLMGLACIVTNVGSNPDLIKADFNGMIISPDDKDALKNAVVSYFKNKDLLKKFGERSKSIIEAKYSSIQRYVEQYYKIWDNCFNIK